MAGRAPDTLTPATTWARQAACRDDDPDMYFDERYLPQNLSCGRCPVAAQCLEVAMRAEGTVAASMRFGVFGGLTTKERAERANRAAREPKAVITAPVRISPNGPEPSAPCGTRSAYRRHNRRKETPCEACKGAEARYRADRKVHDGAAA